MKRKRAVVTGASEGIGRAFAVRLVREGFEVTAVARNAQRLSELANELGDALVPLPCDLEKPENLSALTHQVAAGRFDLLINNAGFGHYGKFPQTDLKIWEAMLSVNVQALVALTHAFLRQSQSGDALVNVSSTLAFLPFPRSAVYAATKSFVTSFSESIWYEQKERGVYVMSLCPGSTISKFHERAGGRGADLPKKIYQTAEQVVECGWRALGRRSKPTVISGVQNKVAAKVPRLLSRKLTVQLVGKATKF